MPQPLRKQLALVYSPQAKGKDCLIEVDVICCQRQVGGSDTGLFAIANALALASGINPDTVSFLQFEMRRHLHQCLQAQELSMFPHKPQQHCKMSKKRLVISTL